MDFISIYVLNYKHIATHTQSKHLSITKLINYINLNKLNRLKHGNNFQIVKTWFPMKYFFLASDFRTYTIITKTVTPEV